MKEVQNRVVQFSNRYKLTNAETGEVLGTFDFDEVTGTVQQVGTEIDKELFDSIANDLAARVVSAGGELAGTIVTFSDISGTAANVASGDTSATLWGKVKNWFSRLKALAFKNKVAAGDFEAGAIKNADVAADAAIAQSKVSGLETALDAKANDADLAAIAKSGDLADATQDATHRVVTDTEKAAWNAKQNTITGGASTITSKNLTDNRALVSNGSGKVAVSDVTATELGYLDGVKSNIQEQLDNILSGTEFVSTSPQTLTDEQKLQARKNISAAAEEQALKNMYNLGAYDTFTDNGDGTATITRKTKYGDSITEQTEAETSYTEEVILDQPIHTFDVNGEQFVRDEWEKGLNLCNSWKAKRRGTLYNIRLDGQIVGSNGITSDPRKWNYNNADIYLTLPAGQYTITDFWGETRLSNSEVRIFDASNNCIAIDDSSQSTTNSFTLSQETEIGIEFKVYTGTLYIMLTEGDHAYPYQPYNGKIVHDKQLDKALEDYLPLTGGTINGDLNVTGEVEENSQRVYSPNNEPPYPVTSVAGKTGDVSLSNSDVGLENVDNVRQYSEENPPPYPVTSRVKFDWMNTRGNNIGQCVFTIGGQITSLTDLIDRLYAGGYQSERTYYPVFTMVCTDTTTASVLQNSDFDTPVKGIYVYNYSSAIIGAVGVNGQALTSFNAGITIGNFTVRQV